MERREWKPQDKFLPWPLWSFFLDNLGFDFHVTHSHMHISLFISGPLQLLLF